MCGTGEYCQHLLHVHHVPELLNSFYIALICSTAQQRTCCYLPKVTQPVGPETTVVVNEFGSKASDLFGAFMYRVLKSFQLILRNIYLFNHQPHPHQHLSGNTEIPVFLLLVSYTYYKCQIPCFRPLASWSLLL